MNSEKIVLVRMIGGLGNQMYQYALAKNLSVLNDNAQIMIDTTLFKGYCWPFELPKLNIKASIADKDTILKLDTGILPLFLGKMIDLIPWIRVKDTIRKPFNNVYTEKGMYFHPEVLNAKASVYIKGYWASYKYFSNIRSQLLEDFAFKDTMNDANKRIAEQIENSKNSVALHIRRGDYLKSYNQSFYYSPYEDGFYQRAISELENKYDELEFFLFSDEPDWVKENLNIKHKFTVVDINKKSDSFWDMKLMSLCKHNIIANSSFSWWGAWLNQNPSKTVMAPKAWMSDPTFKLEDIIPPEWLIL